MTESKRAAIARAVTELLAELGRLPTVAEIAARAGADPSTVRRHRRSPAPSRNRYRGDEDAVPGMVVLGLPEDPP